MRKIKCKDIEDAKVKLQKWNIETRQDRKWLCCTPEDSYQEEKYRIELWVLEGSPVKAIAIINHRIRRILVMDGSFYKELELSWDKEDGTYETGID